MIPTCFQFKPQQKSLEKLVKPLHPNISKHILHTVYIYQGTDKENLFNNQELFTW